MTEEEVEPLYNAESQDIWLQSAEVSAKDNASLRKAGTALAEAALRVIREYDGTHRLALAVASWSEVVANEGGRAALAQSDAEPEYYSYPDMDGITTRNVIPAQSDAEPVADEGHHTLCKILRAMEPWPCKQAANEIERLARDLRLAESARDYANDVLAYAKEQLADRSEK